MTTIAMPTAALAILSQSAPSATDKASSAVDTILDIVSNRKATSNAKPREAGGTVSSEISKAAMGAMNAAVINGIDYNAPPNAFRRLEANKENAINIVGRLTFAVENYNEKFNLTQPMSAEDWAASKDEQVASWRAMGRSEEQIDRNIAWNFGEGGYERYVDVVKNKNDGRLGQSHLGGDMLKTMPYLLAQVFNVDAGISYDQDGRASASAFEIKYGNGQTMLSYASDGSFKLFDEDGSLKHDLTVKQAAKIAHGYVPE